MTSNCAIWVNIVSDNGLLPDGTKPLPEPNLTYHKFGPVASIWGHFHKVIRRYQLIKQDWNASKSLIGQWVKRWIRHIVSMLQVSTPVMCASLPLEMPGLQHPHAVDPDFVQSTRDTAAVSHAHLHTHLFDKVTHALWWAPVHSVDLRHSCQPIRSLFWNSMLTSINFNMGIN